MPIMPIIQWLEHNSILLMLGVFAMVVAITYWPGRKPGMEQDGRIPLEDER
jgi:cbb3-type cytochrome oxidase subunit 3